MCNFHCPPPPLIISSVFRHRRCFILFSMFMILSKKVITSAEEMAYLSFADTLDSTTRNKLSTWTETFFTDEKKRIIKKKSYENACTVL